MGVNNGVISTFLDKTERLVKIISSVLNAVNSKKNEIFSLSSAYDIAFRYYHNGDNNVGYITLPRILSSINVFEEALHLELRPLERNLENAKRVYSYNNALSSLEESIKSAFSKFIEESLNSSDKAGFSASKIRGELEALLSLYNYISTNEKIRRLYEEAYSSIRSNLHNVPTNALSNLESSKNEILSSLGEIVYYVIYAIERCEKFGICENLPEEYKNLTPLDRAKKFIEFLSNEGLVSLRNLSIDSKPSNKHIYQVSFGGIYPNDDFLLSIRRQQIKKIYVGGFDDLLEKLTIYDPFRSKSQHGVVISGYSGVGKSTLILKTIYEFSQSYNNIIFIHTGSSWKLESIVALVSNLKKLYPDYNLFIWMSEPEMQLKGDTSREIRPIEELRRYKGLYWVVEINYSVPQRVARRLGDINIYVPPLNKNDRKKIREVLFAISKNINYEPSQEIMDIVVNTVVSSNSSIIVPDLLYKIMDLVKKYRYKDDLDKVRNLVRSIIEEYTLPSSINEQSVTYNTKYKGENYYI